MYTAKYYQQLCESFGFGRPISVAKTQSWQTTFEKVVKHFKECKVPTCRQYGVARTSLLLSFTAAELSWADRHQAPAERYSKPKPKSRAPRKIVDMRDE